MSKQNTIVLISNEEWDGLWFSKHHYAAELSKQGYLVYFVNPAKRWSINNLFSIRIKETYVNERLRVINYTNNLPIKLFPPLAAYVNDVVNSHKIALHLKACKKIILWQFDVNRFVDFPGIKKKTRIYHVVDPIMHHKNDKKIALKSDLLICVNKSFSTFYRNNYRNLQKVITIPHAISENELTTNPKEIERIKAQFGNYCLLIGSINNDINFDLITKIKNDTKCKLIIAGQITNLNNKNKEIFKQIIDKQKIIFVGLLPAMELKNYVKASKVCLTLYNFKPGKFIDSGSSLKNLIYLVQKKPVISTLGLTNTPVDNKGLYPATNKEEFFALLTNAWEEKLKVDDVTLDDFIKSNFYSVRIKEIMHELEKSKRTIICYIVSHINKALEFEWVAQHLDREKFSLAFILLNPGDSALARFAKSQGLPVYTIPYAGKRSAIRAFLRVFALLRKLKPDIVHTHMYDATFLGQIAARLAGIKKRIYTRHHSSFNHVYHPHAVKKDKLVNRLATHIVSISGNVSNILQQWENVPLKKVRLIPHCIDLEAFAEVDNERIDILRKRYKLSSKDTPVVGVIARYTQWKGIQYIIPAFQRLLIDYPSAVLVLANAKKGEFSEQIDLLLAELPKGSFREIPFEQDLFALYQLFDVFVHTPVDAHSEAFGQIYTEALAAGIPSVFTLSGIAPDFIQHNKNAIVVDFQDSEAIRGGIKTILKDHSLRKRLIQNGIHDVTRLFALKNKIKNLEDLYLE